MNVYTVPVGCTACLDSPSGHCAQHPPASRAGEDWPSGQRRYFGERPQPPGGVSVPVEGAGSAPTGDFEWHDAGDEPTRRRELRASGPVRDFSPAVRAPRPRRARGSKGWRRHLRRTKAQGRGRS